MTDLLEALVRHRLQVRGVVQGVGFRPFVHRLATRLGLSGHVGNDASGVFAEVEGPAAAVAALERALRAEPPPMARVDGVEVVPIGAVGEVGFRIVASRPTASTPTFVAPDVAVCDDCLGEMHDPADRRFRHPFVTCTNCGPRFTITARLPYDRPNTTMAAFPLCPACTAEYHDPADRRFHAQPLACPACGPTLSLPIAAAQKALAAGRIVAVKGLGGYHLACDPFSDAAVGRLRERKGRVAKPFAVMARDLDVVRTLAAVDAEEARLLSSPARPVVLLRRLTGRTRLADGVAPGNPLIGVMLPYSPLHHLLLEGPEALVMTSGNLTDEPIAYQDDDARRRLAGLADVWLGHDRPIHVPCDDSVVRVVGGDELPIRRSRGYTPLPVRLPFDAPPSLAVGGELKTTFCLASGPSAWMSQHIGDMGSVETLAAFERSTAQFQALYGVSPELVVADLHPGYHTRQWAERQVAEPVLVQHHHAHVASLMAEHAVPADEAVVGVVFDGTGYGPDGAIWGGEILVAGYAAFERAAHLANVPLPGGDATIRRPYRAALAHLRAAGIPWDDDLPPVTAAADGELDVLRRQLERGTRCVPTSSMGRLFDAVSSLLGLRQTVTYEAQAAIELEALATRADLDAAPVYAFGPGFSATPLLRAIVNDLRQGRDQALIAAGFHRAVATEVADAARRIRARTGIARVGLTGGVFQNALLTLLTRSQLTGDGFDVMTHRVVPPNDGGLALGQIAVAAAQAGATP